jgi:hypothetical protein
MRKLINALNRKVASFLGTTKIPKISDDIGRIKGILEYPIIINFLDNHLFNNVKYNSTKRITHYHKSVFTQNGEDGIIEEIFNRIGTTNKFFVEFGVHGVKNNSTLLLVKGWKGLWIGGDKLAKKYISDNFSESIRSRQLIFLNDWITRENIESILIKSEVPETFDFLSIDLDGNDYWIWDAIKSYSPRVICIEYNATYPPEISWIMAYRKDHVWDGTSYFGASLKALEMLGREKGYVLIGCDFAGCNAFFIRSDQNLELFESPFTTENHYESPRYFLQLSNGHQQGFGPFVTK